MEDLTARTVIIPLVCGSEQGGGGFPAFMMAPPLPLLKKPIKHELPHPMTAAMGRMNTQDLLRRGTQWKSCQDANLDRGIRRSVEADPQGAILRRKAAGGVSQEHVAGDESFARLNTDPAQR